MNKSLLSSKPVSVEVIHCHHCWNAPRTHTALTSTVWCLSTFSKHWWMSEGAIFSACRNSVTYLCFIYSSMSDSNLSDCPSTAVCLATTACSRVLVGKLSLYCNTTSICLWCPGPTEWTKRHYFWSRPLMFAWSFQSSSILASEGVLASIHLPAFIHSTCCLCFCLFISYL